MDAGWEEAVPGANGCDKAAEAADDGWTMRRLRDEGHGLGRGR
ncbi:MAG: hypothetical protein ACYCVB_05655 [Bacilli bacterium]